MTFEIEYYNEEGILRTHSLFKIEDKNYYISWQEKEWLLCEECLIGLLTLLHIPYSEFLNYFTEKENSIAYFPINETIIFAINFPSVNKFWAKQVIKNWLEDDKFILTEDFKSTLLNQDLSRLDSDLQNRLSILLTK